MVTESWFRSSILCHWGRTPQGGNCLCMLIFVWRECLFLSGWFACMCVGAVTFWDVFHPLITYMTCQPCILHFPALRSQMKMPRCHLRPTHSFKRVYSPRHNWGCSLSLSLFHFLLIQVQQYRFCNTAHNVFLGHWGLSQSYCLKNENIVFGKQCINVALRNSCVFEEHAVMNYFTQP